MESNVQTIEGGRAEYAYKCAERATDKNRTGAKYKTHVKKLPMMIQTSGLGAATAFAFSKKNGSDKEWANLTADLENWLVSQGHLRAGETLHTKCISVNSQEYRALTMEVMALLGWLRRFVEGLIDKDDNEG